MTPSASYLNVVASSEDQEDIDLVSELFHRINRVIPEDQEVIHITPSFRARDAIKLMAENSLSQLPVIKDGRVLGVFSYRSFSKGTATATLDEIKNDILAPGDLTVDELMETWDFASVTDEWRRVFDRLDSTDGVLIGSEDQLVAILSPMDLLRYLDKLASPFVMMSEIELSLRALIRICLDETDFSTIAKRSLAHAYADKEKIPKNLEEMTFENYRSIISHRKNWSSFEGLLGNSRARASGKLKQISKIRNDLFHFRREISVQEHEMLSNHRNWLLSKTQQAKTPETSRQINERN